MITMDIMKMVPRREVGRITRMANDAIENGCKESDVAMAIFNEIHRYMRFTGDKDDICEIAEFSTSIIKGIKGSGE
tara:strand:+ start:7401 stop:7628 length:228 start_codon:yes stop_codon:yes gene_type:complete